MKILKNNLFLISIILAAGFYFLAPGSAFAARGTFTTDIFEVTIGDQVQVDFFIDTEDIEINAVEGRVSFPAALFEFEEIREGNSAVNFWVDKPELIEPCSELCEIFFSGIIPGGYNSKRGLIFSFVLKAIGEGEGKIIPQNMRVLLNDGQGTQMPMTVGELALRVSPNISGINRLAALAQDSDKPEFFTPLVSQDPNIFDGKYFLVFATQDKNSGIAGYSVYESREYKIYDNSEGNFAPARAKWVNAQSPYLLEDQELHSYIFIKAADKAGNERVVMLSPQYPLKAHEYSREKVIIIGTIISVLILLFWNKKIKKSFIKF